MAVKSVCQFKDHWFISNLNAMSAIAIKEESLREFVSISSSQSLTFKAQRFQRLQHEHLIFKSVSNNIARSN
jgi:hypothetical protein